MDLGHHVLGLDNLNATFNQGQLKKDRLDSLKHFENFTFHGADVWDLNAFHDVYRAYGPFDVVYHLAAQPGVKQSIEHPGLFTESNLVGFANVLEVCRQNKTPHLIFASSSSVYGEASWACNEEENTDNPKSYYAATKKANEVMAASYSNLYGMRITGVRLFTVYGPWGRPDMAAWKFTDAILNHKPITLYSNGDLSRDFTYIDDAVDCLIKLSDDPVMRPHLSKLSRFQIYNVGSSKPIKVSTFVRILEELTGQLAIRHVEPASNAEVSQTWCDMTKFRRHYSSEVKHTDIKVGLRNFVSWFTQYQTK